MTPSEARARTLEDTTIPVKLKLSAAWAALMFLYAYGDIFAYFRPGFIEDVTAATILLSTIGDDYVYYYVLSLVEAAIAFLIVWLAWTWPEQTIGPTP
jgi:hypothetical protein